MILTARSGSATTDSTSPHQTVTAPLPHEAAAAEKINPVCLRDVGKYDITMAADTSEGGNFQNKPVYTSVDADGEVNRRT